MKGKVSKTGYRANSKDKGNDFNFIPSNSISMQNVQFPVMLFPHSAASGFGKPVLAQPNEDHFFPNHEGVLEIPMKQFGGGVEGVRQREEMYQGYGKKFKFKRKKQDGGETNMFDGGLSPEDARTALIDGHILGNPLSDAQRSLFAQVAGTNEDGELLDENGEVVDETNQDTEEEEMRRGGQHNIRHRGRTSKNIKSSVNELFLRNHQVYGPSGKHIYDPKAQFGREVVPQPNLGNLSDYKDNSLIGNKGLSGHHESSDYMGTTNHDLGLNFTPAKGKFDFNAGNYFQGKSMTDWEKPSQFNPYIGVNYNGKIGTVGVSAYPGYVGASFTKTFEEGGETMKHKKIIPMPPHVFYVDGVPQNPWTNPYMQMGGVPDMDFDGDSDYDVDNDYMKKGGAKHWIQGAVKHPGRCTPGSPNYDCPKGSPQWRLAQTFKKHHGFHQDGGDVEGDYENNFDNPFFQVGGGTPQFKTQQDFSNYYGGKLKYTPVQAGSRGEYVNPADYVNNNGTWVSPTGAPIVGNHPQKTFAFAPPNGVFSPKVATPKVDTSNNMWQTSFDTSGFTRTHKQTGESQHFDRFGHPIQPQVINAGESVSANPVQKMGGQFCAECVGAAKEGGEFLKSLVKNAYKDVTKMKKGGQSAPQGMTGDDIRAERSNMFKSYLSNNAMKAIAMEEVDNMQSMMAQYGGNYALGGVPMGAMYNYAGNYRAQQGMETQAESLDIAPEFAGYVEPATANTGVSSNPIPGGYMGNDFMNRTLQENPEEDNINVPQNNEEIRAGVRKDYSNQQAMRGAVDPNPYNQNQTPLNNADLLAAQKKPNWFKRNGTQLASGLIAGMNFGSAALNAKNTRVNQNLLNQKTNADNIFSANTQMNRGEYDTNSGVFKPNQYTPVQNRGAMKMGGEHGDEQYLSAAQIKKLKAQGYEIHYLD